MKITEIKDIQEVTEIISNDRDYTYSDLNLSLEDKYTSGNGYRMFKVDITKDDTPIDIGNGKHLYTVVNPRFRDTKSTVIPIYSSHNNKIDYFRDKVLNTTSLRVFIGDGYIDILEQGIDTRFFSFSIIIVMDMMYDSRYNALEKLIKLTDS